MNAAILDTESINYTTVFHQLPTGVVIINGHGVVLEANKSAKKLLGNSLIGEQWLEILKHCFAPKDDDGHEVSLVDGKKVNVAITSLCDRAGEMIVLNDLTTIREFEDERAKFTRLQEMGEMLAHLAHQIRTPLSAAVLYLKNLSYPNLREEKKERFIGKIKLSHQNIEQQIQDLLVFAKGGRSFLELKKLSLLLETIESKLDAKLHEFNIEWSKALNGNDIEFLCHVEALEGAISNLIDNAINAEANKIHLSASAHDNEDVIINVIDNGNGMTEETIKKILRPFFTTRAKGTGLGLAVVEAVVKSHHGKINILSKPGKGSTFSLQIPVIKQNDNKELL